MPRNPAVSTVTLCSAIHCPWWDSNEGCQRFVSARLCHLLTSEGLSDSDRTELGLVGSVSSISCSTPNDSVELERVQKINNRLVEQDGEYIRLMSLPESKAPRSEYPKAIARVVKQKTQKSQKAQASFIVQAHCF
jgi:hypothetical protein